MRKITSDHFVTQGLVFRYHVMQRILYMQLCNKSIDVAGRLLRSDRFSAVQEISRNLWNPDVHYCINKSTSLVSDLRQTDDTNTLHYIFLNLLIHIISLPHMPRPSQVFTVELSVNFSFPTFVSQAHPFYSPCFN
jgi:hypothetical protein